MARVDTLLVGFEQGQGTAGKLLKDEALYSELRSSVAELRKLDRRSECRKGTAGKLLKSEELHDQLRTSLSKVDLDHR